ncbi:MAG: alpha-ketoglutarate-dependent dioxygenase AlkB [Burkholderiaceae bacterium]|jgi:alkylated DNA repair dioxygenase AlkB|nr:alpha-ketoglutarate-dependent dioxygenase AlkB [Burkholderiaceae bacterium]
MESDRQASLFDAPVPLPAHLPEGLRYEPDFLDLDEERALIALVRTLPFEAARYKQYSARRRVVSYGGSFDYDANRLRPSAELVVELHALRARVAQWLGVEPAHLVHVLVAEYAPGTPLGWHRDVPDFEDVAGVSLGGEATMRFRPYPPEQPKRADIIRLALAPRSIYLLRGIARWRWQHSVAPTNTLRWSITFRTARRKH